MKDTFQNYKPRAKQERLLAQGFASLKDEQEALNFMRDLMTPDEIEEISSRLEVAKLLESTEMPYREIATKLKTSTTTVSRVAQWLNNGCGGYKKVLKRLLK